MKLLSRMKRIQEEIPSLKVQCRELLTAKQGTGQCCCGCKLLLAFPHLVMQMILHMLTSTRLLMSGLLKSD